MTAAEHAIENAVSALERGLDFEEWAKTDLNLEYICASAREVWDMAQWVLFVKCHHCRNKTVRRDGMTNADRIRQMTDEELVEFIDIDDIEDICRTRCAKTDEERDRCMCYGEQCKSHILKWLKQEVKA